MEISAPLFFRDGRNGPAYHNTVGGKPVAVTARKCGRCGGQGGSDAWKFTDYTCFDCGGSGRHKNGPSVDRLYTSEELAKAQAGDAKRAAKKAAKAEIEAAKAAAEITARSADFIAAHGALLQRASVYAANDAFIADVVAKGHERAQLSDKQVEALERAIARHEERAAVAVNSTHIYSVGERVSIPLTCTFATSFQSAFGVCHIIGFITQGGSVVIYKGSSKIADKGESLVIKATIKEHGVRDGVKQTIISRPVVQG